MVELKKILIAEDEITNSILLKRLLTKAGYSVVAAHNGIDALKYLDNEQFDAVLTDWMMPQMDGIELIRRIRLNVAPVPLVIMITALVSEGARQYALESGADDYIAKPIDVDELLTRVKDGIERRVQGLPSKTSSIVSHSSDSLPPSVAVVIATSTGGPPTLIEIFRSFPADLPASFFVVQHGPPWMLETFSQRLQRETKLKITLAAHNAEVEVGNIYIAPGDRHLRLNANGTHMLLDDGPKENYVRPSADPLFRSVSTAYGKYCIAAILTGLGRDGTQGAAQISSYQGTVLVQDPETAVAPSMPRTVIESGIPHKLIPLSEISKAIADNVILLNDKLLKEKRK